MNHCLEGGKTVGIWSSSFPTRHPLLRDGDHAVVLDVCDMLATLGLHAVENLIRNFRGKSPRYHAVSLSPEFTKIAAI